MKKIISLAMCLCTMLVVTACSGAKSDNPLIGKWEQVVEEQGAKAEVTYEFDESGEITQTFSLTSSIMNVEAVGNCEYTYENGTITFKFSADDLEFYKFEIEGVDQSIIDSSMEAMKDEMVNVEQTLSDVKINGDVMTAIFNGQQITLKRI